MQCLSPVLSQPRPFAVNITNLKLMTHTDNMITTQSHSAATDPEPMPRCSAAIQSRLEYLAVSMRKIRLEKTTHWKKNSINSELQCNFLIDCTSCCASMRVSRLKTVSYIFLIFRLAKLCKDFDQFPFLQNQQNLKTTVNHGVQTMSHFFYVILNRRKL